MSFQFCREKAQQIITGVDQFGAVFRPSIKLKNSQYKTFYGGLFSIFIYGTSLAYFIYGIYEWQIGKMLPNIVLDEQKIDSIYFFTGQEKIFLFTPKLHHDQIHPFNKTQIIMMALLHQILDGEVTGNFSRVNIENDGSLLIKNLELAYNYPINGGIDNKDQEYYILLTACQTELLLQNEQCAQNDVIQQFWDQDNFMTMEFNTQQYNTQHKELNNISRQFHVIYNSQQTYYNQMYIETTHSVIDTGLLFPSTQEIHYVSDIITNSQSVDIKSFHALFKIPIYMVFDIEIDNVKTMQFVSYPNISLVLAEIGSIVSLILFLSFIAIQLNQKTLENEAINDVIKLYFPELSEFKIKRNWTGQIVEVMRNQQIYDINKYQSYYNKLADIAQQKLCFLNQIYEMSRLQFALQTILDREELLKIRDLKLKISLKPQLQELEQEQELGIHHPNNISIVFLFFQTLFLIKVPEEEQITIKDIQNESIDVQRSKENFRQNETQHQNLQILSLENQENQEIQDQDIEESAFDLFCLIR